MTSAKVGLKVIANGFRGTITRVCEWSDSMVEVRLERGTVCVDFNGIDCYPIPTSPMITPTSND